MGINHWYFETVEKAIEVPIKYYLNVDRLSFLREATLKYLGIMMISAYMMN